MTKSPPKTPAMLAEQIEREMHRAQKDWTHYENEHGVLYENDLEQICPKSDKDRRTKIRKFAEQYGFRLRFYREGLLAIFDKRRRPMANDTAGVWPLAICDAPSAKQILA